MSYRPLDNSEITALENQGCFSSDWSRIAVSDSFSTDAIHHVRFVGAVKLGSLGGVIKTGKGEGKTSGLYSCKIENCEIGNDVLLDNVQLLKNYRIMDSVIIEQVHSIAVNTTSSFGNGFEIEVLNEGEDSISKHHGRWETASPEQFAREDPEPDLDLVHPRAVLGCVDESNPMAGVGQERGPGGEAFQDATAALLTQVQLGRTVLGHDPDQLFGLVGVEIIQNDHDGLVRVVLHEVADVVGEVLFGPRGANPGADHLAGGHLEPRDQGLGAVTLVLEFDAFELSRASGFGGVVTFQGLDPRLLVHADHVGALGDQLRGVEIEAGNLGARA